MYIVLPLRKQPIQAEIHDRNSGARQPFQTLCRYQAVRLTVRFPQSISRLYPALAVRFDRLKPAAEFQRTPKPAARQAALPEVEPRSAVASVSACIWRQAEPV